MSLQTPEQTTEQPQTGWGGRRHVLDLDDFSPTEIGMVLDAAEGMREVLDRGIKKVPSLRGKVVLTLFYEPSTRTRVSFEQAGKLLSADVINISASGSSAEKGESLLNAALTLQAMHADLIVIRHHHAGAPYFLAGHLDTAGVINAGDGRHAHPTQALLDLFTMRRHLSSIEGAKVVIVGDVLHSRVARSNIWGLLTAGARVVLCGPPTLMPPASYLPPEVEIRTSLDAAIEGADVVMALRLQQERQETGMLPSLREYTRRWLVNEDRLRRAKQGVLVMHPGPLNEGIELSSAVAHGVASRIQEQVTNGVAVRMALLYLLLTGQQGKVTAL
jgi:aspartate carbamoyltransferase catalytic subunit